MAKIAKRIGYELLSEELQALIGGETGGSEIVEWVTIINKPESFPPSTHTHIDLHKHNNKLLLDGITSEKISLWESVGNHNHDDRYYTELEVNDLLVSKSNTNHTHTGIAPTEHTHTEDDIIGLDKYTKSEVNTLLSSKSPTLHTHTESDITGLNKYTKLETDTLLNSKSPTVHNHDGAYYKKAEVDGKIANKANTLHTHNKSSITDFAHTHSASEITNLNIPSDTNQLVKSDVYTKVEVNDMMVTAGLGDMTKAIYDTDGDGTVNYADVANSVNWSGVQNKPLTFPSDEHGHSELHSHINKSMLDLVEEIFTTTMKNKLASLSNYTHPTGDGNLHVPSNGIDSSGKVLKSTNIAGGIGWGSLTAVDVGAAATSHMHTVAQITNFPSFSRITLSSNQPTDGYWFREV